MTLLAATLGLAAGIYEAGFLRLTPRLAGLQEPDVSNMIWFLAPLVVCLTFAILGLAVGIIISRFTGPLGWMLGIAFLWGNLGAYLATSVELAQAGSGWILQPHDLVETSIWFVIVFAWALVSIWLLILKKKASLVTLLNLPLKPWALTLVLILVVATTGIVLTSHGTPATSPPPVAAAPGESGLPNVVFITWDTVRADHISAYGYSRLTTPNLDRLAAQGVLFEQAISPSSWTLPTFASMFTGLLPHQHGANLGKPLDQSPRTVAEILSARGYETAGFNANDYNGLAGWGIAQGFQTYHDISSTFLHNLAVTVVGRIILQPIYQNLVRFSPFDRITGSQLNEEVYRWYRRRSRRPYFLFVNYFDAHRPYSFPEPFDHRFGHATSRLLERHGTTHLGHFTEPLSAEDRESLIAAYDNGLSYLDAQFGELLKFLSSQPEWSNTYVIVTSDHGEGFGEHGTYDHGWNLYRELVHVPLVVYGPGLPKGMRIPYLARTRELFSTILDLTAEPGAIFQRTSLRRFWKPGFEPSAFDDTCISELADYFPGTTRYGLISLMTQEWHYLHISGRRSELYHWPTDPLEQNNLVHTAQGQVVRRELRARLLHNIARSLRPWLGLAYLVSLDGPRYPILRESQRVVRWDTSQLLADLPEGASQAFFRPNPSIPQPRPGQLDEELVKSLPYD